EPINPCRAAAFSLRSSGPYNGTRAIPGRGVVMSRRTAFRVAVSLLATSGIAVAQVDNRVQPYQTVPGRARDANNQVGSGGFNSANQSCAYINSANAIMSGNVTGLGGFHYAPTNSLGGIGGNRNSFNVTGLSGVNSGSISNPYLFGTNLPSADIR